MIKGGIILAIIGVLIFVFSTKNTGDSVEAKTKIVETPVVVDAELNNKKAYYHALVESESLAIREARNKYNYMTQAVEYIEEVDRLQEMARESLQVEYGISKEEHMNIVYDGALGKM